MSLDDIDIDDIDIEDVDIEDIDIDHIDIDHIDIDHIDIDHIDAVAWDPTPNSELALVHITIPLNPRQSRYRNFDNAQNDSPKKNKRWEAWPEEKEAGALRSASWGTSLDILTNPMSQKT